MPRTIRNADQRLVILKTLLEVFRTYCGAYFPGAPAASSADDVLLIAAIMVGQAERRPMNASKLSGFAGMPRPTVIRKLKGLERAGILEVHDGAYSICPRVANGKRQVEASRRVGRLFTAAAAELSKMDTHRVAP